MSDPTEPTPLVTRPPELSPPGASDGAVAGPRAGSPARPGSFAGRAHSFRRDQADRRSTQKERIGELLVVAVIVFGAYTAATASSYSRSSSLPLPSVGPEIIIHLGTPSVSVVPCGGGGTAYAERIPWTNSTQPLTPGDVALSVYEIGDRDYVADPGAVADATPSDLCAGTPPNPGALWYVVLAAPNGTNLLTYTWADRWAPLSQAPASLDVENDSTLVLVSDISLAGTGRGLELFGSVNNSTIAGAVPL
jgi:hypothetical protein